MYQLLFSESCLYSLYKKLSENRRLKAICSGFLYVRVY